MCSEAFGILVSATVGAERATELITVARKRTADHQIHELYKLIFEALRCIWSYSLLQLCQIQSYPIQSFVSRGFLEMQHRQEGELPKPMRGF